MAFITQYNFQRIIVNQDTMGKHGLRMDGQDGLLYAPRQIDWFNDLEASRLYLCQILLLEQNHALFAKMIGLGWLKIYTPADDYTRAAAPKPPAYHCDANCRGLRTEKFRDFQLPVGFAEIYGIDCKMGVQYFRQWLHTQQRNGITPIQTLEDDPKRFQSQCEALWPRLVWGGVVLEQRTNSGTTTFCNYLLADIERNIDALLAQYRQWLDTLAPAERQAVEAHKRQSAYRKGLSFRQVEQPRLTALLETFQKSFKNPMRENLLALYYHNAWHAGLDMRQSALDALGFQPCKICHAEADVWQ